MIALVVGEQQKETDIFYMHASRASARIIKQIPPAPVVAEPFRPVRAFRKISNSENPDVNDSNYAERRSYSQVLLHTANHAHFTLP